MLIEPVGRVVPHWIPHLKTRRGKSLLVTLEMHIYNAVKYESQSLETEGLGQYPVLFDWDVHNPQERELCQRGSDGGVGRKVY